MRGFTEEYQQDIADEQKAVANKGRKGLGFSKSSNGTGLSGFVPAGYKPTPPAPLNTKKKFGNDEQTNKSMVITNENGATKSDKLVPSNLFPTVYAFLQDAGLAEVATLFKKTTSLVS
jgi:hypothetical protein